jgi:general secretion pathway protein G
MEPTLRTNLKVLRELIDQYRGDQGHPPPTLGALVDQGYIRLIPYDPIPRRNDTWIEVRQPGEGGRPGGIVDVHSGAAGRAQDGTRFADW